MKTLSLFLVLFAASSALAAADVSVSEFLRDLMREPSRIPVYGEGLKVADQIAAVSPSQLKQDLPVIFEALGYERDAVKLNAALALHAVALRPDGRSLLEPHLDEILKLLERSDERLKMTAPMVVNKIRVANEKALPRLTSFLLDTTQPARVKNVVVCTLMQIAPDQAQSRTAIGKFLESSLDTRSRIDAINAVACQPTDDLIIAQIVARNLDDKDADVRAAAIQVVGRFGPKAIDAAKGSLLRIANRPDERPDVRRLAEKVAAMKWDSPR